ncbi:MAG: ABC transporter ATP-binding protein [Verrucomicrobia bacterium]|nr:ABC transporter ATP-binding protein [Verrucomicrobiota bacterium]
MALLELDRVSKTFRTPGNGSVHALDGLSMVLDAGQFLALQGPSGCGKTTLLLIAGGLLEPTAGSVRLNGQNPYALTPDRRARFRAETIGFVFQQFHLAPYLNVLDNVLSAAIATGAKDALPRAQSLIARFGLEPRMRHVPGQLSTGERQRTALARAVLNRPKLLLADEPTGNLDRASADIVLNHLAEFAQAGGAVLLVSHSEHAVRRAQRVIPMRDGKAVPPPDPAAPSPAPKQRE